MPAVPHGQRGRRCAPCTCGTRRWRRSSSLRGLLQVEAYIVLRDQPAAPPCGHRALHGVRGERSRFAGVVQRLSQTEALYGLLQEATCVQARLREVQGVHRKRSGVNDSTNDATSLHKPLIRPLDAVWTRRAYEARFKRCRRR